MLTLVLIPVPSTNTPYSTYYYAGKSYTLVQRAPVRGFASAKWDPPRNYVTPSVPPCCPRLQYTKWKTSAFSTALLHGNLVRTHQGANLAVQEGLNLLTVHRRYDDGSDALGRLTLTRHRPALDVVSLPFNLPSSHHSLADWFLILLLPSYPQYMRRHLCKGSRTFGN